MTENPVLTRFAWLSIGAAILTLALKSIAYLLTGSVGLLSDAMESVINLAGAVMALAMLIIAARPADEDHEFGHSKAEYFSSGLEGMLILIAALCIGYAAIERIVHPKVLEKIGLGLVVSIGASFINLGAALIIMKAGKKYNSITLVSDARHLLTDVWTSAGVVLGVGAVAVTGLNVLDPVVAILVAANIVWMGIRIVQNSVRGLMDVALPEKEQESIRTVLWPYNEMGVKFHALRTRQSGTRRFVTIHVLVPGDWTVQKGHQLLECLEDDICKVLPSVIVFTHLESLDDPSSWDENRLEYIKKS